MPKPTFPLRENVLDFEPYSPGMNIDEIRERYQLENIIKLASNENPLGTSPVVQKRLSKAADQSFRYVQAGTPKLTKALASFLSVPENSLVVGNGSDEIIDLIIRTCPTPGVHNVVACRPSFSMYRLQAKLCDVEFKTVPLKDDFSFDWQGLLDTIDHNTALVFLTTPDNPSGYCPPLSAMRAFIEKVPPHCLVVVDEAYVEFCDDPQCGSSLRFFNEFPNLAILRTFSKIGGLAGIRLGYGILPLALAKAIAAVKPPFSVNVLAQEAGLAIIEDKVFLEKTFQTVQEGRRFLTQSLEGLGCKVFPSQTNFLMFALPKKCAKTAKQVFEDLLTHGIIIRPLNSYALPDYLRVTVGTASENTAFITSLAEVMHD